MASAIENEATRLTLEYINQMIEPRSLEEIKEGLGGKVVPDAVERILESLAQAKKIEARLLKTAQTKIYWKCRHTCGRTATPASNAKRPFQRTRLPFKSPARIASSPGVKSGSPDAQKAVKPTGDSEDEVERLKQELREVDAEINGLSRDYSEHELQRHIDKLHEYNEIKDVGQMLMGRLAELQGTTTNSVYGQFGLGIED